VKDVGLNIVKGIWEGINNAKDWVLDKIKGFGKGVLDGIKGVFGIHSPSTVFRDEVGVYLAKGLGEGFVNEMDSITKDISGSIPTDFEVNGVYNMRTSGSFDTSTYNAFASVVSDILVPALQTIGINVKVEADSNGMFKVVKSEAEKFYKRTGLQPFPA
jgi:hypothetical protein